MIIFDTKKLWSKIDKQTKDECWEWQGTKTTAGYGVLRVNYKLNYAHRLMWQLHNRTDIPKKGVICHKCDNPPCCNPAHLFLGSQADNLKDARNKGRLPSIQGERHFNTAITEDNVRQIRYLGYTNMTKKKIGEKFGISRQAVTDILYKRTWGHVDPEWQPPDPKAKGKKHPFAKLTENDVKEIRRLSNEGMSQRKLAAKFGVSRGTIEPIIKGETWKHVT